MIPKIINYCWFGGNPLPDSAKKCIESWEKYCPNYKIIKWDETNFNINCCQYVKQAYEAKKWAFVSDFARFEILFNNGGIYFDTDVELIKPIDDIVEKGPFMGIEKLNNVAPGLGMATYAGHPFFKEIIDIYKNINFIDEAGNYNMKTIVEYTTELLKKYGLEEKSIIQNVYGIYVYPIEYFSPKNVDTLALKITENTYSIHHFDGSWLNEEGKYCLKLKKKYVKFMPKKFAGRLAYFNAIVKYRGLKVALSELIKRFKRSKKVKE